MNPMRGLGRRKLVAAVVIAAALAVSGCTAAEPEQVATPTPSATLPDISTIAVVGDSMSLGVNACAEQGVCEQVSWAVGTDPAVNSVASRWGQLSGTAPETMALARPGAGIGTRDAAIRALTDSDADLVLVLVGANDICTASMSAITPTETFAAGYADLLARTRDALPDATVVALSIPDLLQLWRVGRTDPTAVKAWNSSTSCTSMLDNATSDAPEDEARRAVIQETIDADNAAIAAACAASEGCISDGGAVNAVEFTKAEVSTLDHFHPSVAGQAAIAAAAWTVVEEALVP
ncbi:GDSL-like Lipase/Acylhydrolase family protein [Microbacterium sp. cf046]|uniref:SGNH/GDSL hydrolase family protein n=1 Tax=Microbacterium sp. cf046 TaxID=1761803 RepID=UPI0008E94911|nr:SGNH/GDSL hydrolase family protein [Microbacterium sp. cf046]SFR88464.1 GDSL-like Lipase/Acylhydrolase family protein [Microbacterium sp. cf046]